MHVQYAARHQATAWRGDSDRFGAGVAILLGDLALVYSDQLLTGRTPAARAVFDEVRLEVNLGQYLDIVGGAQGSGSRGDPGGQARVAARRRPRPRRGPGEPCAGRQAASAGSRARRICRYKTAKYTVERPLHLGAALARPERLAGLAGPCPLGLPLGEAFQLRDDLLGVFGDPDVTGKPVGDDLREGKLTLLASLAWARRDRGGSAQAVCETRFGRPTFDRVRSPRWSAAIEDTGARPEVEATIDRAGRPGRRGSGRPAARPRGPSTALRQIWPHSSPAGTTEAIPAECSDPTWPPQGVA